MGVVGIFFIKYIYISYNIQDFEMRTLSKSGDFSEIDRFVYNLIKISGMIPSILSYVPPSAEF